MSVSAPDDAFLDVNDAHLRVYGNVHADGLKLGQLEVVTTTSTGSTIQFLHQHTAFTTTSNIDVGTTNHELFVDTNLSRVGILTNTPTTALDVNGTVTATAFAGDGANLTGIPSSAINGTLSQWTTVTGPKIHYSDGNVGVGVADPAFKLDVDGDINFTGTLREDGNPFVSTPWTIESGPTALSYTGGNVGIGAGTPSAKLEVTGNAHVSTDLSVGGNLTINTISAAATHGLGAVTALSNTTAETILLTNTGTSLVASGIVTASTFSDGTAQLTGGTWSGSAARLTTAVDIGGVAFDGSASIVPTTFGAATFSGDVTVDTDTLYVDSTNNRVLIGTTTPYYSQRFEVSGGNSRFAGGVYSRSQFKRFNYNFSTSGNNNHTLTIPINGSNARGIMKLKINVVQVAPNASSADIAELEGYISAYGGTHGITATKAVRGNSLYAEHICSSSTSSSGDLKIYYQPIEGYQQSVYVAFDIELQLGATFANAGSLSHTLSSSNTGVTQSSPHMAINTNGVGIRTASPSFPLSVSDASVKQWNAFNNNTSAGDYTFTKSGIYLVGFMYGDGADGNTCEYYTITAATSHGVSCGVTKHKDSGYLNAVAQDHDTVRFWSGSPASALPAGFNSSNFHLRIYFAGYF